MMKLRQAQPNDLSQIMEIIGHAQQYLAQQNIDQWQNGYPPKEWIIRDIDQMESFVLENDQKQIVATTAFIKREEPNYNQILGSWLTPSNAQYGVVHRLAIHKDYRRQRIADFIMEFCENDLQKNHTSSMRIDTHKDNIGMQNLLKNRGYQYCGVITLEDSSTRLAFEKVFG